MALANGHDHLYSLPNASSFAKVGDDILALPRKSQQLRRFLIAPGELDAQGLERLRIFLSGVVGLSDRQIEFFITKHGLDGTLADLCATMSSGIEGLRRILTFKHSGSRPRKLQYSADAREMYTIMESMRRGILLSVSEDTFAKIFADFFRSETYLNRVRLDISVPISFYQGEQWRKLVRLREINKRLKKPSLLRFLLSAPRRSWLKRSEESLDYAERYRRGGEWGDAIIHGIDLTGSIFEDMESLDLSPAAISVRITALFEYCWSHALALRLHAFENSSEGPFYEALKLALNRWLDSNSDFPFRLQIGHVVALNRYWINLFHELQEKKRNLQLIFEANLASNIFLQGSSEMELLSVLLYLGARNLNYEIGSDGRGMIRTSAVMAQIEWLLGETGSLTTRYRFCAAIVARGMEPFGKAPNAEVSSYWALFDEIK